MKMICLLCVLAYSWTWGQEKNYKVDDIQPDLKRNANVVVRNKVEKFVIHSKSTATHVVHEVFTILNESGKRYATEVILYSKLQKVNEFNGMVYDAGGTVIRKLKKEDIYDQSAISGFSLYEDNRLKAAELGQGTYPYTVEFNYEVAYKFLFFIPGFNLVEADGVAVENSSYVLASPPSLKPRFKLINTDQQPKISMGKDWQLLWGWSFKNVPAIRKEPFGPEVYEVAPRILAGPTQFEYQKYFGDMNSWDSFGQWIISLNKGRGEIPEATRKKVSEMTEGLSLEEKIKTVYEYMQGRTRYVSIQIGIGGFQPFEAAVVDETGYGDCKALSNYTVSLLKAAGVNANYVLIRAGRDAPPFERDFPSTQFNHAVVAVPNEHDTLWLECTSQTNPFGYMGSFTGDRNALMITDNGAKVVRTPRYPTEQNTQSRTAEVYVEKNGNAKAKVKTTYAGLQYENEGLHSILNDQFDNQKKWVEKNTSVPAFDLNAFSMLNNKSRYPSAIVNLELSMRNYASVSGKRVFLNPNLMNRSTFMPEKVENRKTNVRKNFGYVDYDTIRFHLPEDLYPEFVPAPIKLTSKFGEYEAAYRFDQGKIIYFRKLKIYKGEFGPETYGELLEFYRNINKADQTKIVFLGKT